MKKKITLAMLAACILACFQLAEAQQPKKVLRIGYLSALDPSSESARSEVIRLALRERDHILKSGEADRIDDSAQRAGEGGSSDQVTSK